MKKSVKIVLIVLSIVCVLTAVIVPTALHFAKNAPASPTYANTGLPRMDITTLGNEEPKNKTDYVTCGFKLTGAEGYDDIDISVKAHHDDEDGVGIRLRGNSTQKYPKKPYRIKFDSKQSLFGADKAKSWVLLADYLDVSLMQNRTALTLAKLFDNMYSNKVVEHVELYFNGDYRGVYLLTEQIDEKKGRLGLDEYEDEDYAPGREEYQFLVETGFDIVDDPTTDMADVFMIESFVPVPDLRPGGNPAEIKYPETKDGRPAEATEYISGYVNDVFTALFKGDMQTFGRLADVDSFIDYILLNEAAHNSDAMFKSIYMYKKKGEKMHFGPVWDFDGGFGSWSGDPYAPDDRTPYIKNAAYLQNCLYARAFLQNAGEELYGKTAARYMELLPEIRAAALDAAEYKVRFKPAAMNNLARWYPDMDKELYHYRYDGLVGFISEHSAYLQIMFQKPYDEFCRLFDREPVYPAP